MNAAMPVLDGGGWFEADITVQVVDVSIGRRDIAGLHRQELLLWPLCRKLRSNVAMKCISEMLLLLPML
jgi:hypothetical protein